MYVINLSRLYRNLKSAELSATRAEKENKMSFAAKHNKGSKFSVDTEGWSEYRDLKSLYKEDPEAVRPVYGFYINKKSQFGNAPVIICDGYYVNCPKHMLDDVMDILQCAEDIADINDGKVGFKVRTYEAKNYKNKKCYGVEFVDM